MIMGVGRRENGGTGIRTEGGGKGHKRLWGGRPEKKKSWSGGPVRLSPPLPSLPWTNTRWGNVTKSS